VTEVRHGDVEIGAVLADRASTGAAMTLVETFVRSDRAMAEAIAAVGVEPPSARLGPVFATGPGGRRR
jgi:hypothetical protein